MNNGVENFYDDTVWNVINPNDISTWPEDDQRVEYVFNPFNTIWKGNFVRPNRPAKDISGGFTSYGGFCDWYDATHWKPDDKATEFYPRIDCDSCKTWCDMVSISYFCDSPKDEYRRITCPTCKVWSDAVELCRHGAYFSIISPHESMVPKLQINVTGAFSDAPPMIDFEPVPFDQVSKLLSLYERHGQNGVIAWARSRRKKDVVESMKDDIDATAKIIRKGVL